MLVQERLLTELSLVMKGTPEYTDDAPAPFVPKKSKWARKRRVSDREAAWQADPASVSLALHTLMVFDLPIGTLFNFVKRCVMILRGRLRRDHPRNGRAGGLQGGIQRRVLT